MGLARPWGTWGPRGTVHEVKDGGALGVIDGVRPRDRAGAMGRDGAGAMGRDGAGAMGRGGGRALGQGGNGTEGTRDTSAWVVAE